MYSPSVRQSVDSYLMPCLLITLMLSSSCCISYPKHRGDAVGNPSLFVVADVLTRCLIVSLVMLDSLLVVITGNWDHHPALP